MTKHRKYDIDELIYSRLVGEPKHVFMEKGIKIGLKRNYLRVLYSRLGAKLSGFKALGKDKLL